MSKIADLPAHLAGEDVQVRSRRLCAALFGSTDDELLDLSSSLQTLVHEPGSQSNWFVWLATQPTTDFIWDGLYRRLQRTRRIHLTGNWFDED